MINIKAINEEINRLNAIRAKHYNDLRDASREELLKLDWLKDTAVWYYECAGIYGKEYSLKGIIPEKFRGLNNTRLDLVGKTKDDLVTLSFNYLDGFHEFVIASYSILAITEFIKKHVVKVNSSFDFDHSISLYQMLQNKIKGE